MRVVADKNMLWGRENRRHAEDVPAAPDIKILTYRGQAIPAHSSVLASASPVFERLLGQQKKKVIRIAGVPREAVLTFIRFLYCSRCGSTKEDDEEELGKHGMHMLVLSHVYQVRWLKRACEAGLAARLTSEAVADVLQLARHCDARWLYFRCMKLISKDFSAVETTEGWHFLQDHNPWLELEILEHLQESELRIRRRRRMEEEQRVYLELSEAMECLQHICAEGCTEVGPRGMGPVANKSTRACPNNRICLGLQVLILHFANCVRKTAPGGCGRCKRMWQLLRLHSCFCNREDSCQVPLCKQFQLKKEHVEIKKAYNDKRWSLLVKKVVYVSVMTTLAKRKGQVLPKD